MSEVEATTLQLEIDDEVAEKDIAKAVSARHSIARKYVLRLRRRNPDATPAEVVRMLERHYATSITTAGALITAGTVAANIGIGLIPMGSAAATGAKSVATQAAKKATQEAAKAAVKSAAKNMAMGTVKMGAERIATLIPAGDQQLQFELTAVFALALADIHSMELDQAQAHALVLGLSNERVSQQQIATMAEDVATRTSDGVVALGNDVAAGSGDWSHWATTLASNLPGGAAQTLVKTIQTGQLETVRENLNGKQQAAINYGVSAVAGGATRFVFGREVIASSRTAFPDAPGEFPPHLELPLDAPVETDVEGGSEGDDNRALAALEEAAKATGSWITGSANAVGGGIASGAAAVGTGVATAASAASRPFRNVDLDGDGIPDAPRAVTAVKGVGAAIGGVAGKVGGGAAGLFKSKKRSENSNDEVDANGGDPQGNENA